MLTHFDEKGKIFTQVVSKVPLKVIIQTTTHQLRGQVHIRPDERLKNVLDHTSEAFLAVTEVEVISPGGEIVFSSSFMAVNRHHIIWVIPEEDLNSSASSREEPE